MQYHSPLLDRKTQVTRTGYFRDAWRLVRCEETGFVFLPDAPDYERLETEFSWEKTSESERERRVRNEPRFSRVSSLAKGAKQMVFAKRNHMARLAFAEVKRQRPSRYLRVLDLGCGEGGLLKALYRVCEDAGYPMAAVGVEVSKVMAARASVNLSAEGGKIIQTNAFDAIRDLDPVGFEVVLMNSFLEHERHPLRLLRGLHNVLSRDGSIVIKVPNFGCWNRMLRGNRWCGFRYPDHVNYFTPGTLRRLAVEAEFAVVRQSWLDRWPTSDNMYAVLRHSDRVCPTVTTSGRL